ncbi:DUF4843 domain-containing protein [Odoribacter sp. AF15-53]|uniref:DUF4843 domain-containing protein n=1 Tax=Odoribacter sp. AF15-53 TaxID=2292236 RepID=UPI000E47DE6E|nr:DUF4843 domain-containing protein [Odoribacter sp. AF15-53]RHR82857.1 DUF4843 domain-containing protein [Odoribacter sp. AF15-53]
MKFKYLIYLGITLLLGACSNRAIFYDPDQKRSIYFYWDLSKFVSHVAPDTMFFSFAIYEGKECEYHIPVKSMGMPVDKDQHFDVEIVSDSTTAELGKHYEFSSLIIPKNEVDGILSLKLKRTEDIVDHPVILYLRFKENDNFKPMEDDYYCLSIIDGKLAVPVWWYAVYFGEYNNNNDRLYLKILENFWALEELKPMFYAEKVKEYGQYLEKAPAGFFQFPGNIIWIKYVFKPAYDFYCDPANTYEGFAMVNPDRFIR